MLKFIFRQPNIRYRPRMQVEKEAIKRVKPEYIGVHRIADKVASLIKVSLLNGLTRFMSRVKLYELAQAVERNDLASLDKIISWDKLSAEFTEIEEPVHDAIISSGKHSQKYLPKIIKPEISFDSTNPRIALWIKNNTAKQVTNITENGIKAIGNMVRRSFDEGLPYRQSAMLIRDSIGLNEKQGQALFNYHKNLVDQGVKGRRVEEMTERYSKELLKYRTEMIVRTESIRAVNYGQMELWNQAGDLGLVNLDRDEKEWVVTPDDALCEYCEPLSGMRVRINGVFDSELGSVSAPPLHPACRCSMSLVFNK